MWRKMKPIEADLSFNLKFAFSSVTLSKEKWLVNWFCFTISNRTSFCTALSSGLTAEISASSYTGRTPSDSLAHISGSTGLPADAGLAAQAKIGPSQQGGGTGRKPRVVRSLVQNLPAGSREDDRVRPATTARSLPLRASCALFEPNPAPSRAATKEAFRPTSRSF